MARLVAALTILLVLLLPLVGQPVRAQQPAPGPPPPASAAAPPVAPKALRPPARGPAPPRSDIPPDLGGASAPEGDAAPPAPDAPPVPPPAGDDQTMFLPAAPLDAAPTAVDPAGARSRPGIEVAIGIGASLDARSRDCPSCVAVVPGFIAMVGFGTGVAGVGLTLFSDQALGRSVKTGAPLDRLGGDVLLVVRPGSGIASWRGRPNFGLRVARSFALALGPGVERVTSGRPYSNRFGLRVASHVDVPLSPAHDTSELRLRLGARRFFGQAGELATGPSDACLRVRSCTKVGDNILELFGALAVVF